MTDQRIFTPSPRAISFQRFVPSRGTLRGALAILLMFLGVIVVYLSPAHPNTVLMGEDYLQMHSPRMQFARDALLAAGHSLPGWYPRELLGTPFWSNLQNFPFIPTRLLIVLTMDPMGPYTYEIAVTLSAVLAALFMYLYSRKIGLGLTACAVAGWTFACSGFYAARVAAGHLPLLEGYPALPLLLWVIESQHQVQNRGESARLWIIVTAVSSACVMLAGHPQLPVYALFAGAIYAFWRSGRGSVYRIWAAMIVGIGCSAFALVPMGLLIGRSTRLLALAPSVNDTAMPYGRLAAFFLPWRDGMPSLIDDNPDTLFRGYPNLAYFWDTVCYIGILPWFALLLVFIVRPKRDEWQGRIAIFHGMLGVAGIVLSLPFIQQAASLMPGTIFRSPARLIYLTQFALAIGLGFGIHLAIASQTRIARWVVPFLLILHLVDLGGHDRRFILRGSLPPAADSESLTKVLQNVGDGRAAIDFALALPVSRTVDDIGFFDSIMLARPYRMILSLIAAPQNLNIQTFEGSKMPLRALAAMGVKTVLTKADLKDLTVDGQIVGIKIYGIPSPSRRAEFFAADQIRYLPVDQIHAALRDANFALPSQLLLPLEFMPVESKSLVNGVSKTNTVEYRRPDSDHIECTVTAASHGYLRIIESWDPGWSATVDGSAVPILPALDALLAVPIAPGRHEVRFVYRTPGASAGQAISLLSLALLCGLVWSSRSPSLRTTILV